MFDFKKLKPLVHSKLVKKKVKPVLTRAVFKEVLQPKIPADALEYCTQLWEDNPFSFSITKTRSTCLGNYKFQNGHHTITVNHDLNKEAVSRRKSLYAHTITVNHDLNPYNFLITYIHEVAHQHVAIKHQKNKPVPHGKEWKLNFQHLMIPVLNESVFPLEILKPLAKHMINPPASSTRDVILMKALKSFNEGGQANSLYLENIPDGQTFIFKKRKFQKIEKRRTRILCQDVITKRKYTIPIMAEIELL